MQDLRPIFAWLSLQNLTGEELRILLNLMSRLNYDRYTQISQVELAQNMNLHKTRISKAIRRFLDLKIILKGPKFKQTKSYMLNSAMANPSSEPNSDENDPFTLNKPITPLSADAETISLPMTNETKFMLSKINKRNERNENKTQ